MCSGVSDKQAGAQVGSLMMRSTSRPAMRPASCSSSEHTGELQRPAPSCSLAQHGALRPAMYPEAKARIMPRRIRSLWCLGWLQQDNNMQSTPETHLGCLPLVIVEVGGHGDDRLSHGAPQVPLRSLLHLRR